jgi:lysophospholipase L1-like esterase
MKTRGPAEVANLSVNGAESPEVRDLVEGANVRSLAATAAIIVVSVGGNDLSHSVPRGPGPPAVRVLEDVTAARTRYAENLRAIVAGLRQANAQAPILLLGLYDPFGPAAGSRLGGSVILRWNDVIAETALSTPGTRAVPSFDLFDGRPDRLAVDKFHPNRKGYAAIAARMVQLLPDSP